MVLDSSVFRFDIDLVCLIVYIVSKLTTDTKVVSIFDTTQIEQGVNKKEREIMLEIQKALDIPKPIKSGEGAVTVNKQKAKDYHKKCHDCGKFVPKKEWVPKDHRWKHHALCYDCWSNYDTGDY